LHLRNSDGSSSIYRHQEATVSVGDRVSAGQTIGRGDGSGGITGPHLHYEFIPNNETTPVDPLETQLKDVYEN
jgi:murein DD-endopeptidase MepM/ murein hydrolase activator NlpD